MTGFYDTPVIENSYYICLMLASYFAYIALLNLLFWETCPSKSPVASLHYFHLLPARLKSLKMIVRIVFVSLVLYLLQLHVTDAKGRAKPRKKYANKEEIQDEV